MSLDEIIEEYIQMREWVDKWVKEQEENKKQTT